MPTYKKLLTVLVISAVICVVFMGFIYRDIRVQALDELNTRQMGYATLAARGISELFDHHIQTLNYLAQTDHIIKIDTRGKTLLRSIQELSTNNIASASRLDATGRVTYTWPHTTDMLNRDLSDHAYVQRILSERQTGVSDIFTPIQGFDAIALHAPVWRNDTFDGAITFLISFRSLTAGYLQNLTLPDLRYTLLVNEHGKILYCPETSHIGYTAADIYGAYPGIIDMVRNMLTGRSGRASYVDAHVPGKMQGRRVHAVYTPIPVGDTFWSLAVVSSEELIMPSTDPLKYWIVALAMLLLVMFGLMAYIAARIRSENHAARRRRQIEEDLIRSAEEIRDLYDNAPCGYHSLDAEGRFLRINETELVWLGYDRDELIGKPYDVILLEDSRRHFKSAFARLKEQGLVSDVEYKMRRKDGSTFPVLVTASAVTDGTGRFLMTRSMVMDITARRATEERLRESEMLYRTALETTNDGISIFQDGKYVYVNKKLMESIGRPDETLIGRTADVFVTPQDQVMLRSHLEARLRGEAPPSHYDVNIVKPDGSQAIAHVTTADIIWNDKPAILSFIVDCTERRRAEEALKESETLYRTALENTSDGITVTDIKDAVYLYVNQRLLDTLGRPDENMIGLRMDSFVHPDDVGLGKKYFRGRKANKKEFSYFESRAIKPDGSIVFLGVRATECIYHGRRAVISFLTDITEHKQAENALRESEALYRTAMETTSDGVSIIQDGKYVYCNQRLLNTLGRPDEDINGRPVGELVDPDDLAFILKAYEEREKGAPLPSNYEERIHRPDGSTIYVNVTSTKIRYRGKPAILSFLVDITERKKAENALQESEALYRTALESTSDGVSIIQDGKYVYANRKLLKTIGREETGILGLPVGVYIHPDDRLKARLHDESRLSGDGVPYGLRVLKPDGSIIIINVNAVTITYQGRLATLSFVLDITERKKAEDALRHSEERYRTIIESIDDDYFEIDLAGRITFINKPIGWSGHSREELIGMAPEDYTTEAMAQKGREAFKDVYRTGKPLRLVDFQLTRKDGSIAHLEMAVSLIRDTQGRPVGFRGISRDVSDRFKMEEVHRKLTDQLYQAQKMEAIGTLAGGIAHDFNNLLMGIQGYTSLMLLEVDETHPYHPQLKAVQTLVQSGATLTRQLLGFARAGRYEVTPTDLNRLIAKSVNLFSRTRKEIQIHEKYDSRLRNVEVDKGQIEQVLLNLFVNAWQAMPGGGSLYVETENLTLDATGATLLDLKPGRYVKVSITDTGIGMDEKTKQRIFDPFFTTKEMGRGTGLGLASAYGIIKGHGGNLTVYSEKGYGSTFNIYLQASIKDVQDEEEATQTLAGGRETILVVDDESIITDVTGRLLEELGYTIISAGGGEEAVSIYRKEKDRIDLIIVDMIMPGMSGSDTFDALKAINPDVRVILSSGYSVDGKAQSIMDRGVREFLQKPYRLDDLAHKIRQSLS